MEPLANFGLLDGDGKPFRSHIERALRDLAPRLQRQFVVLQDEVTLIEILEEAGRRISERERKSGPIEKLHAYAWVTVRSVATSRLRQNATRIDKATLRADDSESALSGLSSTFGTVEATERRILLKEILSQLSHEERMLCIWKREGFSSDEIGARLNMSSAAVDSLFRRVKAKVARGLGRMKRSSTDPRDEINE